MKRSVWITAACFVSAAILSATSGLAFAQPDNKPAGKAPPKQEEAANTHDVLLFRDGKMLYGKIVSETATTIRLKSEQKVSTGKGIPFETDFKKADILKIDRNVPIANAPKASDTDTPSASADIPKKTTDAAVDPDAKRVYVMELTGRFGRDISQTPIREALDDARRQNADYVVVVLQNDWDLANRGDELDDDAAAFDELFRAEDMAPIFTKEIPEKWRNQPKVIFWVKKAMGGAAFLPLICSDIYFHPEAKMGGIGNLTRLFNQGDEVVKQKQYSLRMGHAEGLANTGGYDYRLVRAMATTEYVLSVSYEGGKPVYHERMPEGPAETLLTDDGKNSSQDTDKDVVAGEGNDVLTLNAKLARDLQISKGTVETLDDLLFELGISRHAVVLNQGKEGQYTKAWATAVKNSIVQFRKLRQQVDEIPVTGNFNERARARGQKKKLLNDMKAIVRRFAEIMGEERALQVISDIDTEINVLDQQQQKDALDNRKRKK